MYQVMSTHKKNKCLTLMLRWPVSTHGVPISVFIICRRNAFLCVFIKTLTFYQPRSEGDNVLGRVRPSVRLYVRALLFEPFDKVEFLARS